MFDAPVRTALQKSLKIVLCNISTRETVFHWDIQTPRRQLKIRRVEGYFDEM